jgi:hypothetical protein
MLIIHATLTFPTVILIIREIIMVEAMEAVAVQAMEVQAHQEIMDEDQEIQQLL